MFSTTISVLYKCQSLSLNNVVEGNTHASIMICTVACTCALLCIAYLSQFFGKFFYGSYLRKHLLQGSSWTISITDGAVALC